MHDLIKDFDFLNAIHSRKITLKVLKKYANQECINKFFKKISNQTYILDLEKVSSSISFKIDNNFFIDKRFSKNNFNNYFTWIKNFLNIEFVGFYIKDMNDEEKQFFMKSTYINTKKDLFLIFFHIPFNKTQIKDALSIIDDYVLNTHSKAIFIIPRSKYTKKIKIESMNRRYLTIYFLDDFICNILQKRL